MPPHNRMRLRIAQEAARIMSEQGIREHDVARRKAAQRLGVTPNRAAAPRNDEIDAALLEYQRIFQPQAHTDHLLQLRRLAAEAMRFLAAFTPLLCGGVWDGNVNPFTPVTLHLFAAAPDEVGLRLRNAGIPYEEGEHLPVSDDERRALLPAYSFYADGTRIELLVFPAEWRRRSPRRKGGQRPGGTLTDVERLLDIPDTPAT